MLSPRYGGQSSVENRTQYQNIRQLIESITQNNIENPTDLVLA